MRSPSISGYIEHPKQPTLDLHKANPFLNENAEKAQCVTCHLLLRDNMSWKARK